MWKPDVLKPLSIWLQFSRSVLLKGKQYGRKKEKTAAVPFWRRYLLVIGYSSTNRLCLFWEILPPGLSPSGPWMDPLSSGSDYKRVHPLHSDIISRRLEKGHIYIILGITSRCSRLPILVSPSTLPSELATAQYCVFYRKSSHHVTPPLSVETCDQWSDMFSWMYAALP